MLPFARPRWAHVIPLLLALGLVPVLAPSQVPESSGHSAVLTQTRWGRTPKGAIRVVFQFDRQVEFFTAESSTGAGLDVHLIGADPASASAPLKVGEGPVTRVTFRPGPSGTIAQIGASAPVVAKAFVLKNPHRVVIDLTPDRPKTKSAPSRRVSEPAGSRPAPAQKSYKTIQPTKPTPPPSRDASTEPAPSSTAEPDREPVKSIFEQSTVEDPREPREENEFEDLLGWIHRLKTQVDALNFSGSEPERTKYRRSLAYLLAERGILVEAERALSGALAAPSRLQATAFSDSINLAELRVRIGRSEGAAAVARGLDLERATPQERLRIARVYAESGLANLAGPVIDDSIGGLSAAEAAEATLLRARCHWDQKEITPALKLAQSLTTERKTPARVLAPALVLHADCLWALGRPQDAKGLYKRAAEQSLKPEEASWTTLQLANLAHREGRIDDAKALYRRTVERWPDSFYAPQADWFLRLTERAQKLQAAEAARDRG